MVHRFGLLLVRLGMFRLNMKAGMCIKLQIH
ncbi:hypothetical protein Goarm_011512 [Gossypium armourianum]|uniref:Uncharacterized protein n=1 Tax=Gossypium armourianum TaxID=34283 RepID=A0A7J9IX27_9ROSI|nr:hypothetical protein [Gossypium armourianum]